MKENNNKTTRKNLVYVAIAIILIILLSMKACSGCGGCGKEEKVDYVESTETEATFTGETESESETETESESHEETESIEETEATESTENLDGSESGLKKPIRKPNCNDTDTSKQPENTERPGNSEQPSDGGQPGNTEANDTENTETEDTETEDTETEDTEEPEDEKVLTGITARYDNTTPVPEGTTLDNIKSKVTVTANYKKGIKTSTAVVTGFTLSGNLTAGKDNVVMVSYSEKGVTKTDSITVTVKKKQEDTEEPEETKVLTGITATYNDATPVRAGTALDDIKSGVAVTATYKKGSGTLTAVVTGFTLSGNLEAGKSNVVTVSYSENGVTVTTTIMVTVWEVPNVVISIQDRNSVEGEAIKDSDFDYEVSNVDKIGFTIQKSDLHVSITKDEGTGVGTYALTGTCSESSIWNITINPGTYTIIAKQHNPGEDEDGTESGGTPGNPGEDGDGTNSGGTPGKPGEDGDGTGSGGTPGNPGEDGDGTNSGGTPGKPGEDGDGTGSGGTNSSGTPGDSDGDDDETGSIGTPGDSDGDDDETGSVETLNVVEVFETAESSTDQTRADFINKISSEGDFLKQDED